jgi:hypothetical protein
MDEQIVECCAFDNWPVLRGEANDLPQKASRIKIPKLHPKKLADRVYYAIGRKIRTYFEVIKATKPS